MTQGNMRPSGLPVMRTWETAKMYDAVSPEHIQRAGCSDHQQSPNRTLTSWLSACATVLGCLELVSSHHSLLAFALHSNCKSYTTVGHSSLGGTALHRVLCSSALGTLLLSCFCSKGQEDKELHNSGNIQKAGGLYFATLLQRELSTHQDQGSSTLLHSGITWRALTKHTEISGHQSLNTSPPGSSPSQELPPAPELPQSCQTSCSPRRNP